MASTGNEETSSTPAINIPLSTQLSPVLNSHRILVGSPDQLLDLPPSPLSQLEQSFTSDSFNITPTNRPRLGRSVSTSAPSSRRPDTITRVHDIASSLLRRTHYERTPEREWSVFGQLMEHEDYFRAPETPRPLRLRQETSQSTGGITASYLDRTPTPSTFDPRGHDIVQSPTQRTYVFSEPTTADHSDGDSSYDSDDTESGDKRTYPPSDQPSRWPSLPRFPTLPTVYRNILKCSIAYFIGSLFTFSPYLSGFVADLTSYGPGEHTPSPTGHMVATVAVYFNPAKTLGGMVEADIFCSFGLLYATFVALSSMAMYWFFEVQPGWEWLADLLVLLWIGVGMSFVAWMKVWMAKPTFSTACSMTAIIVFIVVVKEGGFQTLLQVAFIVLIGSLISNVICLLLWPQHATKNLQNNMIQTLNSFSTLLSTLSEMFLLEEPVHRSNEKLQRAVESHQASFTSLKKSLMEAQSERMFGGPSKTEVALGEYMRASSSQAYEDAIDSLTRLGQHLNGLRSGISLQNELISAHREGKLVLKSRSMKGMSDVHSQDIPSGNGKGKMMDHGGRTVSSDDEDTAMLQTASAMFGDLMDDLGPPLKALSATCTTSLKRLREAFAQPRSDYNKTTMQAADFQSLAEGIERALFTFESTSNHAVIRLYRSGNASGSQSRASFTSLAEDNQMLTGDESENVFLVYFFIFTLQEFAKELISLVDAMGRICGIERANARHRGWRERMKRAIKSIRSKFTRGGKKSETRRKGLRESLSVYFVPRPPHKAVSFPKIKPHAPNTIQTPARSNLTFIGRVKQSLWALGARLKENDLQYAIKAGMALAILASPAFFDSTRPIFTEYRGEWALISFFVVISPTVGATNFLGVHRVLGTLLGAATAAAVWTAFPENPYALSAFGFFYSMPCFYYIVAKPQYATSARFVLLTYNLTCLYCYNLRQKDIAVVEVAIHRAVAVTVGVVWAGIVSRFWWPTEARRELSKALGDFCLNMGWLYTRLVAFNSFADAGDNLGVRDEDHTPTEMTTLLSGSPSEEMTQSIQEFMAMELHLQIKLIELQGLLAQTSREPRLKGPFPVALYRTILTSLQTILDRLHSMRCVTSREEWHTTVRRDFILPVNKERREMVGNVILYFSTLAAAFRLKSPLPPYLPPAEQSRQRLVLAIRKLDVVRNRDVKGSRHLLFFAYALTMRAVISELDQLGRTLQDAFGVIGQSREEFEALFGDAQNAV